MRKVKNKEALVSFGFKWNEEENQYDGTGWFDCSYVMNTNYGLVLCHDFENHFDKPRHMVEYAEDLVFEMTKAGCFDEKPKTLEDLEYKVSKQTSCDDVLIYVNTKLGRTITFYRDETQDNGLRVCTEQIIMEYELLKAIMLKMEELKNGNN